MGRDASAFGDLHEIRRMKRKDRFQRFRRAVGEPAFEVAVFRDFERQGAS